MSKTKTQSTVLPKFKTHKSCVRFQAPDAAKEDVTASCYLQNKAYKALGEPDSIEITIKGAD